MTRECHVRFCERPRVKPPRPTHHRNGFCLWQKRLERERFRWPQSREQVLNISGRELAWLLEGFDLQQVRGHREARFEAVV